MIERLAGLVGYDAVLGACLDVCGLSSASGAKLG